MRVRAMAVRKIRIYGDKILREVAKPVEKITPTIRRLITDMIDSLEEHGGVGLSANQVGALHQIIVIKKEYVELGDGYQILLNPNVTYFSGSQIDEEGCLSFPGLYLDIARPSYIEVEALEYDNGNTYPVKIKAKDYYARVLLHEIDHLHGILFIDRIPKIKARIALAKWLKSLHNKEKLPQRV